MSRVQEASAQSVLRQQGAASMPEGPSTAHRGLRPMAAPPVVGLGIHTVDHLRQLLDKERARTDRSGREFALVIFGNNTSGDVSGRSFSLPIPQLAAHVRRRARGTDEVAYSGGPFVCALLIDTSAAGGWRFAHDVAASTGARTDGIVCGVYSYPSGWISPDLDSLGALRLSNANLDPSNANGNLVADANGNGNNGNGNGNRHIYGVPTDGTGVSANGAVAPIAAAQMSEGHSTNERGFPAFPNMVAVQTSPVNGPLHVLFARPAPAWKRCLDVLGASVGLVVFSPVMLLLAAGIKLTSRGPIIFRQVRAGQGGRPFVLYKFRSMCDSASAQQDQLRSRSEQDGPAFKMRTDPRVTRFGRFIRKTSLDELPQLWNVLKGDMSLVGPRPLPWAEACACEPWQRRRLDVLPGITCVWQVEGRSRVTFVHWMRMDLAYIRSRSLLRDVWLLIRTIPAVVFRRGAS